MDFSSYYYYIPLNFYETPEMTLIDHEPNGDSATVLVLALAKIHTRTVTKNDDGTFTIVTDDGTFTDIEVMGYALLLRLPGESRQVHSCPRGCREVPTLRPPRLLRSRTR